MESISYLKIEFSTVAVGMFIDNDQESNIPAKVISDVDRIIMESIFYVVIGGLVGVLGVAANIINIIIFYKQGFSNTVNIAFSGLAVSDLLSLIFLVGASVCMNPLLTVYGVPLVPVEVMYITSSWPHICFSRITSYITVYITGERCVSIVFPLKVKQLVTKARTTIIMILIYVVNCITFVPEWSTSNLGWRFVKEKNKTLLAVIFTNSRRSAEGITCVIHSLFSLTSIFGVILFTTILVFKLRQNSEMRNELTSGKNQTGSMSVRDKKAVKMIVLIAIILIVCYIPGATVSMATFIVGPEFNIQGDYINICSSVWSIAYAFQSVNSSVNIFLYYRMSTKYRNTFWDLFQNCRNGGKNGN